MPKAKALAAAKAGEKAMRDYDNRIMEFAMGADDEGIGRKGIPAMDVQDAHKAGFYKLMADGAKHGYKPDVQPAQNYGVPTPKEWAEVDVLRKKGGVIKMAKGGAVKAKTKNFRGYGKAKKV